MRHFSSIISITALLLTVAAVNAQTPGHQAPVKAQTKPQAHATPSQSATPQAHAPVSQPAIPQTHTTAKKSKYTGNDKIRGVNLGGWLVLEPWITPSLFEQFLTVPEKDQAVDEWTFCEKLGREEAKRQLRAHWDTWVTEDDFRKLANAGINHVRIPIGYWAVNVARDEPWVQGHIPYLFKAVSWASAYNMKVMIDLHGTPGSQNGFDNSGKKGPVNWQQNPDYVKRTLNAIDQLSAMFPASKYPQVTSVQLVNEPANWALDMNKVRQFYRDGRAIVQRNQPGRTVAIHDAFLPLNQWEDFVKPYNNTDVILDTHVYHVFVDDIIKKSEDEHLEHSCNIKRDIERSQTIVDTITGEWSLAVTDCAQWLNGFNIGSRWDGTIPSRNGVPVHPGNTCVYDHDIRYFTPQYRQWLKRFTEVQMDTFEAGAGWFFWNFKTEREPQWSYLKGVEQGWIPKDPSKRTYSCDKRR
ncbi:glycoside hydrolase superfamily [Syncephalis fuscata]|nr:glycoside hydrolase superfamily [Syncephalis fuscata]